MSDTLLVRDLDGQTFDANLEEWHRVAWVDGKEWFLNVARHSDGRVLVYSTRKAIVGAPLVVGEMLFDASTTTIHDSAVRVAAESSIRGEMVSSLTTMLLDSKLFRR